MRPGSLLPYIKLSPDLYVDRLVILEDNESDIPEPEPEAIALSASVDASADPAFDLSKPVYLSNHEVLWDVEDGCFVDEDLHPFPLLQQEGLVSTPAQEQPYSCRYPPGLLLVSQGVIACNQGVG
jgi:hypothetical protein